MYEGEKEDHGCHTWRGPGVRECGTGVGGIECRVPQVWVGQSATQVWCAGTATADSQLRALTHAPLPPLAPEAVGEGEIKEEEVEEEARDEEKRERWENSDGEKRIRIWRKIASCRSK